MSTRLAIVTCTLDLQRARDCVDSWWERATARVEAYTVIQGDVINPPGWGIPAPHYHVYCTPEILGVVPAFALGVQKALEDGAEIICAFHDDLLIEQDGWDEEVIRLFKAYPRAGLVGFGGAKGLGSDDLYKAPYNPMQLARQGFRSNMRDAEAHGIRSAVAEPVACLDGFSQIGTRAFWRAENEYANREHYPSGFSLGYPERSHGYNHFTQMQSWGVIHHFYDGMLGCFAKRLGYQVWYLPIRCHHFGGRTAVGDARYHEWANQYAQATDRLEGIVEEGIGDQIFWTRAHQLGYTEFKAELPIRT